MATEIKNTQFETEVLKSEVPVLVDFFAQWCGPCKMLSPVLNKLSEELEGKAKVLKIDIDQAPDLVAQFGIMSIPTLIAFKDGKQVFKKMGRLPLEELKSSMLEIL